MTKMQAISNTTLDSTNRNGKLERLCRLLKVSAASNKLSSTALHFKCMIARVYIHFKSFNTIFKSKLLVKIFSG